jgi:hypothetical protein
LDSMEERLAGNDHQPRRCRRHALRGHLEHFKDLNARKDAAGSGLAYSAVCDEQMALIDRVDATEMQVSMGTGEDGVKDHFDLIVDGDGHGGTDIIGSTMAIARSTAKSGG